MAALFIQGIVGQWMDFVSIYICPLGAGLAGILFAWVWGRQAVEDAVSLGRAKRILAAGTIRSINTASVF